MSNKICIKYLLIWNYVNFPLFKNKCGITNCNYIYICEIKGSICQLWKLFWLFKKLINSITIIRDFLILIFPFLTSHIDNTYVLCKYDIIHTSMMHNTDAPAALWVIICLEVLHENSLHAEMLPARFFHLHLISLHICSI